MCIRERFYNNYRRDSVVSKIMTQCESTILGCNCAKGSESTISHDVVENVMRKCSGWKDDFLSEDAKTTNCEAVDFGEKVKILDLTGLLLEADFATIP
jgi:hypothetical protein